LAKVREGIEKRRRERELRQGWFMDWYNQSPWLTTMISSFVGPVIIIILILIFGPIILNRLVGFVRERVGAVQVMVIKQQYLELGE
ncbi:ENV1 protein, partial [Crypturellus soui]|nr:ENV1 protein [Crypturellus soui]